MTQKLKVVTILGARPQFIKAASVSKALARERNVDELLVHTGQHYDQNMSDVFFDELGIPKPRYNLEIGSGNHGDQTGRMLQKIEEVLLVEKPNWVIVYGDTNSTLAGALAAVKIHIPIAHVEAGLRSFNRRMPEEINRIMTDHVSTMLFAPTDNAADHLKKEGVPANHIHIVGDVMYDSVLHARERPSAGGEKLVQDLRLEAEPFVLTTIHRAENTDEPGRLDEIVLALEAIAKDFVVVFPVHPRTRKILENNAHFRRFAANPRARVIAPLSYFEMAALLDKCALVVTDSGGVQKEAYFFGKHCVTLRHETEWTELVKDGWNVLAPPTDHTLIAAKVTEMAARALPKGSRTIYGDGQAARKIARLLVEHAAEGARVR